MCASTSFSSKNAASSYMQEISDAVLTPDDPLSKWIEEQFDQLTETKPHAIGEAWLSKRKTVRLIGTFQKYTFFPIYHPLCLSESPYFQKLLHTCLELFSENTGSLKGFISVQQGPNEGLDWHRDLMEPPPEHETRDYIRKIFDACIYRKEHYQGGEIAIGRPTDPSKGFQPLYPYCPRYTHPDSVISIASLSLSPGEYLIWDDEELSHSVSPLQSDGERAHCILRLFIDR